MIEWIRLLDRVAEEVVEVIRNLVRAGTTEGGVVALENGADRWSGRAEKRLGEGGFGGVAVDDDFHGADPVPGPVAAGAGVLEDFATLDDELVATAAIIRLAASRRRDESW